MELIFFLPDDYLNRDPKLDIVESRKKLMASLLSFIWDQKKKNIALQLKYQTGQLRKQISSIKESLQTNTDTYHQDRHDKEMNIIKKWYHLLKLQERSIDNIQEKKYRRKYFNLERYYLL